MYRRKEKHTGLKPSKHKDPKFWRQCPPPTFSSDRDRPVKVPTQGSTNDMVNYMMQKWHRWSMAEKTAAVFILLIGAGVSIVARACPNF